MSADRNPEQPADEFWVRLNSPFTDAANSLASASGISVPIVLRTNLSHLSQVRWVKRTPPDLPNSSAEEPTDSETS